MRHMNPVIGLNPAPKTAPQIILHQEGKWSLLEATRSNYYAGQIGWNSVIKHYCDKNENPYWMLLEKYDTPTICLYCNEDMPASIVALFKFQNWERMT